MNYIWAGMILISFVFSLFTGNISNLSEALTLGANQAVELILSIVGVMCFWSGMMEISNRSGLSERLSRLMSPVLSCLFRDVPKESDAMKYISLNISANILGLGNAATPFGLKAMKELHRLSGAGDTASDSMVLFVVLNTASLQLIPTTLGAYRASFGSKSPFDILLPVWVTSVSALVFGVGVAVTLSSLAKEGEMSEISRRRGVAIRSL